MMKSIKFLGMNLERKSAPSINLVRSRKEANNPCYEAGYQGVASSTKSAPTVSPIHWTIFRPIKRFLWFYRSDEFIVSLANTSRGTLRMISGIAKEISTNDSTAETHAYTEIENEHSSLAARMEADIPPMPSSFGFIYRVPKRIRVAGEGTYDPRIISIGPYHHGKSGLEVAEKHKKWYLKSFISRTVTPKMGLAGFVKAIRELEVNARNCYEESIKLTSDEFVTMMIQDGSFILELFYRYSVENINKEPKDVIFSSTWIIPTLRRDLLLLENQIPFAVLVSLHNLTNLPKQGFSLNKLFTTFFDPILPKFPNTQLNPSTESQHLLDLLRNHLIHKTQQKEYGGYALCEYTPSATELSHAGVKFKRKDGAKSLFDITFTKNGVFEIPPFKVGVLWTVLLPNLVALEQCRHDYKGHVTSYVILLDSLIDSRGDVKLLRDKGIIDKLFKEDEKVALSINCLYKRVIVDEFYYDGLCRQVNLYSRADWNRWRATLARDYFNSPWSSVKVFVATVLLILTFIQTIQPIKDLCTA